MNQSNLSQTFVSKSVTIGYRGLSNVLEYNILSTRPADEKIIYPVIDYGGGNVQYDVPIDAGTGTWEAVTGYTPGAFTRAFVYNRSINSFGEIPNSLTVQSEPVIVATPDLLHAIGVISPDRADYVHQYITGYFPGTMKWSCVIAKSAPAAHENYNCYVIIGTIAEVQQSMRALYRNWVGDPSYPLSAPGPVPTAPTIEQVAAYSSAAGRTGDWWCSAHFGANLGGQWQCLSVQGGTCNSDAGLNRFVTCQKHAVVNYVDTYAASPGLTPQWWCSAHFGGNLGGTWDCTNASGYACDVDVPVATRVYCGRR